MERIVGQRLAGQAARGLALALALVAATAGAGWSTGAVRGQGATPVPLDPYLPTGDLAALGGQVVIDGSSTVWPITTEAAELFMAQAPGVVFDLPISGTGGGFRRFCAGESDVQNASRPIDAEEAAACAAAGVAYRAFEIARDGITVVVSPRNAFATCLTVEQLRRLWAPDSTVRVWSDLDPAWPNEPIVLYGPGPDSGTFDFFTEAIVGESGASRIDYTPSESDIVLVEGVEADAMALGYFGYAYYVEEQGELKALGVDAGDGCVAPSVETIGNGSYRPLSRPLFIYVSDASLKRPEVLEFLRFYAAIAPTAVADVGYVPIAAETYVANQRVLEQGPAAPVATPAG